MRKLRLNLADKLTNTIGSWKFIVWQTVIVLIWVTWNSLPFLLHFDNYPFILLNLFFSTQAAYATSFVLMGTTRQGKREKLEIKQELDEIKSLLYEIHRRIN